MNLKQEQTKTVLVGLISAAVRVAEKDGGRAWCFTIPFANTLGRAIEIVIPKDFIEHYNLKDVTNEAFLIGADSKAEFATSMAKIMNVATEIASVSVPEEEKSKSILPAPPTPEKIEDLDYAILSQVMLISSDVEKEAWISTMVKVVSDVMDNYFADNFTTYTSSMNTWKSIAIIGVNRGVSLLEPFVSSPRQVLVDVISTMKTTIKCVWEEGGGFVELSVR